MYYKNKYFKQEFQEEVQKRLKEQIRERRIKQNLRQIDVANALGISLDTYQNWEKHDRSLTDIFSILSVLLVLDFSTADIVDVLGLAPLTLREIKNVCQDEDTLKNIQGNTVYSVMREKCPDLDDFTLERVHYLIMGEHLKRLENRRSNS